MMRTVALAVAAGAVVSFLIYRIVVLESRVEDLGALTGVAGTEASGRPANEGKKSRKPGPPAALTERITSLEKDVAALETRVEAMQLRSRARSKDPGAVAEVVHSDTMQERILDVVNEEADRLLAKQLSFHRDNLIAARKEGVSHLTKLASLSQAEAHTVESYLEEEVDRMVELMRDTRLREDPKRFIGAIQGLLADTDERVGLVLDDAKMNAYRAGRQFERAILMPWLPNPALQR